MSTVPSTSAALGLVPDDHEVITETDEMRTMSRRPAQVSGTAAVRRSPAVGAKSLEARLAGLRQSVGLDLRLEQFR